MAYENVPTESASALISRNPNDYEFDIDLWFATADDMKLFDTETKTSAAQMFDFLDRVVTDYRYRGESKGAGVSEKGIPLPILMKHLMPSIGESLKAQQSGN